MEKPDNNAMVTYVPVKTISDSCIPVLGVNCALNAEDIILKCSHKMLHEDSAFDPNTDIASAEVDLNTTETVLVPVTVTANTKEIPLNSIVKDVIPILPTNDSTTKKKSTKGTY